MDSEEGRRILSAAELYEHVRAVQKERLEALEQEWAEREAFRKAITKLPPQQKRILRWLWVETQKREAYLDKNDLGPEAEKRMDSLRREVGFDLDGSKGHTAKRQEYIEYHDACWFRYTEGGLAWRIEAVTGYRPTKTEKASLSRSLKRLIERKLVQRSHRPLCNDYIILTVQGRSVYKRLTPC